MKLFTVITAVLLLIIPASVIAARPAIVEGSYEFVGFSDVKFKLGDGSVLAEFQNACTAKFGENARWASSKEMLEASYIPTEPVNEGAWVRPTIIDITLYEDRLVLTDYSGVHGYFLSCAVGVTFDSEGLIYVMEEGRFYVTRCTDEFYVACSTQQ